MYCHPRLSKAWARSLNPAPTPSQIAQAALMRQRKADKARFLAVQGDFGFAFPIPGKKAGRVAPGRS